MPVGGAPSDALVLTSIDRAPGLRSRRDTWDEYVKYVRPVAKVSM